MLLPFFCNIEPIEKENENKIRLTLATVAKLELAAAIVAAAAALWELNFFFRNGECEIVLSKSKLLLSTTFAHRRLFFFSPAAKHGAMVGK